MTWTRRGLLLLAPLLPVAVAAATFISRAFTFQHLLAAATLAALLVAIAAPGLRWRRLALSAAALGGVWGVIEMVLARAPDRVHATFQDAPGGFRLVDQPRVGYAARPNAWRRHQSWAGTQLLYEVTYQMDEHGWRRGPGLADAAAPHAAVFLGCSFTFGVGLEDAETLPAQVERAAGGAVRTYNVAMDGYGPHQLLALFEQDQVKPVLGRHERMSGLHLAIPDHIRRVAGAVRWGFQGPRYQLQPDGSVRYTGPFHRKATAAVWHLAAKSLVLSEIHDRVRRVTDRDLDLHAAVVAALQAAFQRQVGGPFVVLAWDTGDAGYGEMVARLRGRGLRVVEVSELVPGYAPGRPDLMRPLDRHPTPACMRQVAAGLAARGLPAFE